MKARKLTLAALAAAVVTIGGVIYAADHIDSPTVTGMATDITDVYVFRGENPNNMVFVVNTQGLLAPGSTAAAQFDPNTLLEFNIDNNNDNVEDLVIQCLYKNGKMQIYGPIAPTQTGTRSQVFGAPTAEVDVTTYGAAPIIGTGNGMMLFAGPRDDPFFFDLNQFKKIIAGMATNFNNPGADTFAG